MSGATTPRPYEALLAGLYERQLRVREDPYLRAHSNNAAVIRRHADAFRRYRPFLSEGTFLEWGCMHGVDSCLVRETLGAGVELHGCDLQSEPYEAFFAFSGLDYTPLRHPFELPYPDAAFDTVIGSGVLEHVPHPAESLLEVARVLRPGGLFVITFLPNRVSYTEIARTLLGQDHHDRRYTRRQIAAQLRDSGLEPLVSGYHQVVPTLAGPVEGRLGWLASLRRGVEHLYAANHLLERIWPVNRVAANLFVVARKR